MGKKNGAELAPQYLELLERSKRAADDAFKLTSALKNQVLADLSDSILKNQSQILAANRQDLLNLDSSQTQAFRDRLTLNENRLRSMVESLRQVILLNDPVGELVLRGELKNGLKWRQQRAPLGVVFLIYESRPNVAIEAFSIALKSSNALILKGGKEARHTASCLYNLITDAQKKNGISADFCQGIVDIDRADIAKLLKQSQYIDVVIPRGGDQLIEFVTEHSRIPVIKNDRGLCHIYVDESADIEMATAIIDNAKTQRPGVCNAVETLLIHQSVASPLIESLADRFSKKNIEVRACSSAKELIQACMKRRSLSFKVTEATEQDWDTEHLDLILNCKIVDAFDDALAHIRAHGSRHSEAIVTASEQRAQKFLQQVDAAATYWNASTRFTDGFELGLGAEIGISTQKLHVRGPVGVRELTSVRWVLEGTGQVRS